MDFNNMNFLQLMHLCIQLNWYIFINYILNVLLISIGIFILYMVFQYDIKIQRDLRRIQKGLRRYK